MQRNRFLYQSQRYKTLGVSNDTALKVTDAYLSVLLQTQIVTLANENLIEHNRLLELIKDRSAAGISRRAEIYQATSRVTLAEANLVSAQSNLHEAQIHYNRLVGSWPKNLQNVVVPDQSVIPRIVEQGIQKGFDNHPLLKASHADIKEAKAQYGASNAALYPKIDLVLNATRNNNLDGLVGKNNSNLGAIRLSYNAFKGGSDVAHTKKAAYQVQEAFETRNKTIIEIKETVRLSYNALDASTRRSQALSSYVLNTEKTKEAYFEQFKIGQRTLLDLLNTQNEEVNAKSNYLQAKNDELFARYRILSSMGCLLSFLKSRIPVNVMNNDVSYSYEHLTTLPYKSMRKIPRVNMSKTRPLDMRKFALPKIPSQAQIHQQSAPAMYELPKHWSVVTGTFLPGQEAQAKALRARLIALKMETYLVALSRGRVRVMVGPYVYKEQASNMMRRIKELTGIDGITVRVNKSQKV